jgi:hypothetical protein
MQLAIASFAIAVISLLVSIASFIFGKNEENKNVRYGCGGLFFLVTIVFVFVGVFAFAGSEPADSTPRQVVIVVTAVVPQQTPTSTQVPPTTTPTRPTPTPASQPSTAVSESSPVDVVERYYQLLNNRDYDKAWAMFTLRFQQNQPAKNLSEYKAWAKNISRVSLQPPKTVLEQTDTQATVQIARVLYYLQSGSVLTYDNFRIYLRCETPNQDWLIDGTSSDK